MKTLQVCYWYVKMPQCGCVDHGLAYDTFYVQKHIAYLIALFWFPAGSRRAAVGARICETPLLTSHQPAEANDQGLGLNKWRKIHIPLQRSFYSASSQCRRCSNYIFILNLKTGFKGMDKDTCQTRSI